MITIGTNDKSLQERLLRDSDTTLEKAIKLGQAAEVTRKHAKIIQNESEGKIAAAISRRDRHEHKLHKKREKFRKQLNDANFVHMQYYEKLC